MMQSGQRHGDFLTRFVLLVVVALGLTLALQARALRGDDIAERVATQPHAPTVGPVLGSAAALHSETGTWPERLPSASLASVTWEDSTR